MSGGTVYHTKDGLGAFLKVNATSDGSYPTVEELKQILSRHGVVHGIDERVLLAMVEKNVTTERIKVASGTPASAGVDGKLHYFVDISRRGKPLVREDGSVDHRQLHFAANVQRGQPLVQRIPPVAGVEGRDVFGRTIFVTAPKDVMLPGGEGTALDEANPDVLLAARDGAMQMGSEGRIEVGSAWCIRGDVDYATGNVDFSGELRIGGLVRSGFSVRCLGKLSIGALEDATVDGRGTIEILGGATGAGKGSISGGETIRIKYVENFRAEAQRDIIVTEDVLNCTLWARRGISARCIIGGLTTVGQQLEAVNLGNSAETRTIVVVLGRYLHLKEREKCLKQCELGTAALKTTREAMFELVRDEMDESGELAPQSLERLEALKSQLAEVDEELGRQRRQCAVLERRAQNTAPPTIRAHSIYPNTIIRYGGLEKIIREELKNVSIVLEPEHITINSSPFKRTMFD